jgi:hypothetical protein
VLLENNTFVGGGIKASLGKGGNTFETFGRSDSHFEQHGVTVNGDITVTSLSELECELEATSVVGCVTINSSTSSNASTIHLDNAAISSNVYITTGGGDDSVAVQANIGGTTSIFTNGGNDTVVIADSNFQKSVTINTGSGNDQLLIEPFDGPVEETNSIPTQFFGAVVVAMGSGNDKVVIGGDLNDQALFFASAMFDGGTGTDTLDSTFGQFNFLPRATKNFETVTPV